jgi:epoxyqueuosine reductase
MKSDGAAIAAHKEGAMELTRELTDAARAAGASLAGIAPVDRFDGAPTGHHPAELLPGARSVLTFGVRLLDRVLEWPELFKGSPLIPEECRLEALNALFYDRSGYDIVNDRLNQIALTLANHLEDLGYPSLFFPATYGALPQKMPRLPGMFSQRHAAVRAGLGEFGLNNVVVTARYGPRIRFNSVITAAPLSPSPLPAAKTCRGTDCRRCLDECPGRVFRLLPASGHDQLWLDPVSRTDWAACRSARIASSCKGRCLRVCPVGRNGTPGRP